MNHRIAFYVHHHGRGHAARTGALLEELSYPTTVLTSADVGADAFPAAELLRLPLDTEPLSSALGAPPPEHLHYAPFGVAGLRERTARITRFLADAAPALLVVDVSVEVAQLARIAGMPVVVVRQHGARWDAAHRAAYDGAVGLLAPFGPELEEPDVPGSVRRRTFYTGGMARPCPPTVDRDETRQEVGWEPDDRGVVVLCGAGGAGPDPEDLYRAAHATPTHRWLVVGGHDAGHSAGIETTGWVDDPAAYLAAADIVVGTAGHNTVMEVASVGRPFVCIPEPRPFEEQRRKADRLRELDVAEVVETWPEPSEWAEVLQRAERRGGNEMARIVDPEAAGRGARWLMQLADRFAA